jgi:isopenicillin-N epimerase
MWSRRAFLRLTGAAGASAMAPPIDLEAVAAATSQIGAEPADVVARDEAYWAEIRRAFVLDRTLINLNNGNSSPSPQAVHDAVKRHLDDTNLLPVYHRGVLEQTFETVRGQLAAEFGCDPAEMAITRNATEALTIVQSGLDLEPGDEVLTTDQDYPRMLWLWDQRARRDRIVLRRMQFPVPTTAGDLVRRFEQAITPRTKVIHFCHITNTTGQLFPVRELCRLARQRGILSIVDGAQAPGHFPVTLRDLECDFYGTSLHKWLMAPHGTGFLFVRREHIERLWPLEGALYSVRGDIRKLEEIGTQSAAPRAAIAEALAFQRAIGVDRKAARLHYLTRRWMDALRDHPRVKILSSANAGETWGLATFSVAGIAAPAIVQTMLDTHRIVVSAAVNQGRPGPVLEYSGVRVTPNIYTTVDEIDRLVSAVRDVI